MDQEPSKVTVSGSLLLPFPTTTSASAGDSGTSPASSTSSISLEKEIEIFIQNKRKHIDETNREEFIESVKGEEEEFGASRTCTKRLEKDLHIKASVVDNQDGPLSRSLLVSSTSNKLVSPHGVAITYDHSERPIFNGIEERVRNVETHLGIVVAPLDKSLLERVKILEDKILRIEQLYPQIASHVFNYGRAEIEASSKPGGRVSRMPGIPGGTPSLKKRPREEVQTPVEEEEPSSSYPEDSSLGELRRRMNDLKHRLLKQVNIK